MTVRSQGVNDASSTLALLLETVAAIRIALYEVDDWGHAGAGAQHPGQHHSDIAADRAALDVLLPAGMGVLSEESGRHQPDAEVTVVIDPLDGSTNAARGLPWYAASLCAVDAAGPLAAAVVNLASGERFTATRGGGAHLDGEPIAPTATTDLADAIVGLSGYPAAHLGWRQYRAWGAGALDLCSVACGRLDAYLDVSEGHHGPWDYLAAALVCTEAGAAVGDVVGRDLVVLDHDARRAPVAAATPALYDALLTARRRAGTGSPYEGPP